MRDWSTKGPLLALKSADAMLAEIERVSNIQTPVIRNLWITQHYHSLMGVLAEVVGADNSNWSTFATWASKTAGQSIRGEEVPQQMRVLLTEQAELHARLTKVLKVLPGDWAKTLDPFAVPKAVLASVSDQIAIGNLKVFAELAPLFVKFADRFRDPARLNEAELDAFAAELAPGPIASGGQDWLKTAFTSYFAAARAKTPKSAAEYILHGNLLIGLHEQTRLQPFIAGAIDAPFQPSSYEALLDAQPDWLERVVRPAFGEFLRVLNQEIKDDWERLATRYMMTLALPRGQIMDLGKDVPVGARAFPAVLEPLEYAELIRLIKTYDPHLDSLKGSGAKNWVSIENRMAFIADLFRSHQQDTTLFDQPFTAEQLAVLPEGKVPHGPL